MVVVAVVAAAERRVGGATRSLVRARLRVKDRVEVRVRVRVRGATRSLG